MSNDDITKLESGGARVECEGPAKQIVNIYGLAARDSLTAALVDPDRFVAAHSALTEITGVRTGGTFTLGPPPKSGTANKLVYNINSDRKLSYRIEDNVHLHEWWIKTVGNNTGIPVWDDQKGESVWHNEGN